MALELLKWDIYQISTSGSVIKGVKLRGRIRKFCLINEINVLAENAFDEENTVRFAVLSGTDVGKIVEKIKEMIPDSSVELVRESIVNPVLSKLKVNIKERYTL